MNIISFDVGIKNMAYCIFSLNYPNITIKRWDVLNLMNEEECDNKPTQCSCKLKNKKQCSSIATFKKENNAYCPKHSKEQTDWLMPSVELSLIKIKKMKINELREIKVKGLTIDTTITRPQLLETIIEYITKNTLEPITIKKQKADDIDLISVGRNMTKLLNELPEIATITHAIIENQISTMASRMTTIQGMLAQYFIMKCPNSTIEYISSGNKLKGLIHPTDKPTYKDNKTNSKMYCPMFVENTIFFSEWKEMFKQHKKKDDLCDAFLQAIWYLKNKKCIQYSDKYEISLFNEMSEMGEMGEMG
jgi:hypothetical protein